LIPRAARVEISNQLHDMNGRRRERCVNPTRVLQEIRAVWRYPNDNYSVIVGGSVPNSYGYRAWTTIVLIVKVEGVISVGVNISDAHGPSPGRAWDELRPWNPKFRAFWPRLRAWALDEEQIRFSLPMVIQDAAEILVALDYGLERADNDPNELVEAQNRYMRLLV